MAKEAYYRRLESLASNPRARDYSREQLRFFFRIDDIVELRGASLVGTLHGSLLPTT